MITSAMNAIFMTADGRPATQRVIPGKATRTLRAEGMWATAEMAGEDP